jgi:hypothetical protein
MYPAMGFGPDQLRDKALLALEEAVQECRFRAPKRSMAIRFALAYLWAYRPTDREPYERYWKALAQMDMWRFGAADTALRQIYLLLDVERDDELGMRLWTLAREDEDARRAEAKR